MKIELLGVRIFITKNEVITDEIGNHKNVWKEYYTCYATVSSEAPKEMTEAGAVVDASSVDFTIRFCDKVKSINSTNYRVQFDDELYNIEGVDHMNYKKKAIKLKCRKVRR